MADISAELERALVAAGPADDRDAAALELARRYAVEIDEGDPDALDRIGPKLLAVLTALGLTPAGRGKPAKGGEPDAGNPANPLDELRARRAARGA